MPRYYEELHHTADWAIRVWGHDVEALFVHAAEAMFELQGADFAAPATVPAHVACRGVDLEALLVAWLNDLLFASEAHAALFTRFAVRIVPPAGPEGDYALEADVAGPPGRSSLAHIKAVTYYDLSVRQTAAGWEATVTFDT
ncbi:MAG: archease [Caldilineales bacterium]|nr:archease [Caldilineales bacterium]MDW8319368.1 archease [Anaerolineae bacterium]